MPSNHLILCRPLLLPSVFPSIKVFSNESVLRIRWPKYWSFSFNISPSNEHSGLISFRMDWLDLLAVQESLKSLFQQHSSKASILLCSAFFIVQLSHRYITTGKTIAMTMHTFVGKLMSLLFNTPKGYAVSNCSHQNQFCNPHKSLRWQVHRVFDHTNITANSDHPIIWHGNGTSPPFPQLDQGRWQGEIWKLALSLKKFQIWDGHYSNKTIH